MRRLLFVLLAMSLPVLAGCESPAFKAERKMYRANRLAAAIFENPKSTPPGQFEAAIAAYRKIAEEYPGTVLEVQAQFGIGHLYLAAGDFDKARAQYKLLATDCDKRGNLCAEAYFAIGNAYELQQDWPQAEGAYLYAMDTFPLSTKGLDLPLYIIRHYRREKASAKKIDAAVDQAVAHYTGLKPEAESEKVSFVLQGLVARSYMEGGRWLDAIDSLDKLARDYPDHHPEESLWVESLIYASKLKDKEKAKERLRKIVSDYPKSQLAQKATAVIGRL
ncbi:MAG: tetratricopeptide repeat protein [Deltaproteobacteria bacterium]